MVATLSPVSSTDAAERYYLDNQASMRPKADYYAVGKEPDGVWLNPSGMFGLPDRERVTTADFHKLFWGFSPEDGSKLSRNAGSAARSAAIDFTFSADKSISALWAIAPPELRAEIERIHNDAAREAFERFIIGECAYTRRVGRDGKLEAAPADLIATMFQHGESREQDPQLHTHIVCFNVAHTPDDGKYRTHYQWPAFMWVKPMGAWYRAAVASDLQQTLGIRMEQYGENNEFIRIAGMPEDLIKTWSKRRGKIVEWAKSQGLNIAANPAHGQAANLNTRKHKDNLGDDQARRERWRRESLPTLPDLGAFIQELVGHNIETSPEDIRELTEALRTIPDDLMRAEAVVRLPEIIAEVARRCGGKLKTAAIDTAVARLLRDPAFVHLEPRPTFDSAAGLRHTEVSTTKHTLLLEETVTDLARSMHASTGYGIDGTAVHAKIAALKAEGYPVSQEQIDAIRTAATSDGRIAVIEGAAGSGKTTTLRPLADLWRDAGKNIIATAVPWRTAMALGTDVDAPMFSVAKLLSMAARDQLDVDRDTVIIADEAGMLSTREIHHLMQFSEKTGAKITFCGDTQQQQPVEAGPGLRLVRDVVGSSRIAIMRRQKADIEDVLRHRHGVSPEEARAEAETISAADRAAILAEFEASPQSRDLPFKPWQIAASEAFRDGDAHKAIAAYRDRGRFHLCRNGDAAFEQIADDVARYTEDNPGKTVAVLARTNHDRRRISLALRRRALGDEPRNSHVIQVSDREDGRHRTELEIAEGDRLRIGATHWQKQLFNGSVVIVDRLTAVPESEGDEPSIRIDGRTEDGRAVSFHHDEIRDYYGNVRLDHGYALTITSAQGLTVDAAFLLADSRSARETMYPAATRHRESLNIYVDRNSAAHEVANRRYDQDNADQIVTDDEIVEHLAKSWHRSSPKQAAHDYRLRQRRAPRPDGPDPDPTPGPAPEIDRHVREDRERALELRYGNEVAAIASGRRQVLQSYAELRARAAAGENVADEPAFRETIQRHAVLVTAAERFRTRPHKFARLLRRRGGLTADDLQDFRHRLKRAHDWRRGRAISKTMAGRAPASARRRTSTPRRIDPRQPLPDRVVQDIERDLEALVPEGPALGASVTSISAAGDVAPDAGDALDATMSFDRAAQAQPAPPEPGDGRDDWSGADWSEQDLADYAEANERSAPISAPGADDEMPEDPGWAEYAASLDAQGGPPAEPAHGPLPSAPRDPTPPPAVPDHASPPAEDPAREKYVASMDAAGELYGRPAPDTPHAPAQTPAAATAPAPTPEAPPTPTPPAPTTAELFDRFRADFAAHRERSLAANRSPYGSDSFDAHKTIAAELRDRPDLSHAARQEIDALLRDSADYDAAPDRIANRMAAMDTHAAAFDAIRAHVARTGEPIQAHPDYAHWYHATTALRAAPLADTAGAASWIAENPGIAGDAETRLASLLAQHATAARVAHAQATFSRFRQDHTTTSPAAGAPLRIDPHHPDPDALRRAARELLALEDLPAPQRAQLRNVLDRQRLATLATALDHQSTRAILRDLTASLATFAARNAHITIARDLAQAIANQPAPHHPIVNRRLHHYSETEPFRVWAHATNALIASARSTAPDAFGPPAEALPPPLDAIRRHADSLQATVDRYSNTPPPDGLLEDLKARWRHIGESSAAARQSWLDHRETPALIYRAKLLGQRADAADSIKQSTADLVDRHRTQLANRAHLKTVARDIAAHSKDRQRIQSAARSATILPSEHPDYPAWLTRAHSLMVHVDSLLKDTATYGHHFTHNPELKSALHHHRTHLSTQLKTDAEVFPLVPSAPAPRSPTPSDRQPKPTAPTQAPRPSVTPPKKPSGPGYTF